MNHCWADRRDIEYDKRTDGQSLVTYTDEWLAIVTGELPDATCMLPAGHSGPHEWTNDSEIQITFLDKVEA